jgi:hypothetical protein
MSITPQQPARIRRPLVLALFVALVAPLGGACGDKEATKENSKSGGSAESGDKPATSEDKPARGEDKPKTETPDLASMDLSFLVDPCIESGVPAEKCRCSGEEAKTIIGAELLHKMSKAPADDDPAIQKYYSVFEMQQIMNWVNDAGAKCGIEEEE